MYVILLMVADLAPLSHHQRASLWPPSRANSDHTRSVDNTSTMPSLSWWLQTNQPACPEWPLSSRGHRQNNAADRREPSVGCALVVLVLACLEK
ncbi:hypothetical protein NL676_034263 [Syzygium grande]|nr:hypothetical protein NL676_034263 [Syzygium grande]